MAEQRVNPTAPYMLSHGIIRGSYICCAQARTQAEAAAMLLHHRPGRLSINRIARRAMGAIDLALWDIKGKALKAPLYELFGGKARQHIELYATNGVPPGLIPQNDLQRMSLKERAAATMAAGKP